MKKSRVGGRDFFFDLLFQSSGSRETHLQFSATLFHFLCVSYEIGGLDSFLWGGLWEKDGSTNRSEQRQNTGVSPLRRAMRPCGSGRDDVVLGVGSGKPDKSFLISPGGNVARWLHCTCVDSISRRQNARS